jgi:hypothetical protein
MQMNVWENVRRGNYHGSPSRSTTQLGQVGVREGIANPGCGRDGPREAVCNAPHHAQANDSTII